VAAGAATPIAGILSYCFEPSVAQPPLPLQEFLPLHPLSPDLHPPWPLQPFWPLQEFLPLSSMTVTFAPALLDPFAAANAGEAPSIPVIAAVAMSAFVVVFIFCVLVFCEESVPALVK